MKETPLFVACKMGYDKLVTNLLELGANYKVKDFLGRSCKNIARRNGYPRIIQVLNVWKTFNSNK